jgi:hypothetical protein
MKYSYLILLTLIYLSISLAKIEIYPFNLNFPSKTYLWSDVVIEFESEFVTLGLSPKRGNPKFSHHQTRTFPYSSSPEQNVLHSLKAIRYEEPNKISLKFKHSIEDFYNFFILKNPHSEKLYKLGLFSLERLTDKKLILDNLKINHQVGDQQWFFFRDQVEYHYREEGHKKLKKESYKKLFKFQVIKPVSGRFKDNMTCYVTPNARSCYG